MSIIGLSGTSWCHIVLLPLFKVCGQWGVTRTGEIPFHVVDICVAKLTSGSKCANSYSTVAQYNAMQLVELSCPVCEWEMMLKAHFSTAKWLLLRLQ